MWGKGQVYLPWCLVLPFPSCLGIPCFEHYVDEYVADWHSFHVFLLIRPSKFGAIGE